MRKFPCQPLRTAPCAPAIAILAGSISLGGCGEGLQQQSTAIQLSDRFNSAVVEGTQPIDAPEPMVWRFDGQGTLPALQEDGEAYRWTAVRSIVDLTVDDQLLKGRTISGEQPTLALSRPQNPDEEGFLHAIEVRMRVSAGSELGVWFEIGPEPPDRARRRNDIYAMVSVPIEPGDEFHTYRLTNDVLDFPLNVPHVLLEPTNAPDAAFEIESIRLISRREHLAGITTGPGWHSLGYIGREAIVSRSPQRIQLPVDLGPNPWLDLAVGTIEDGPATFAVEVDGRSVFRRTVTLPDQWEEARIDLTDYANRSVTLAMALEAEQPGRIGFWGSPVVRHSGLMPESAESSAARIALPDGGTQTPQAVIVILADTLRRDHLDAYGYQRDTAPTLTRIASEGVLFSNDISQASWTKPSVPSILTSTYPETHGVKDFADVLPSSLTTLAEVFRDAGYATFHTESIAWAGTGSRLQQGVEVLHRVGSLPETEYPSNTARGYVTRFLGWLEDHDDVPVFAFLHFFDPHVPREPYPPYNVMWSSDQVRQQHEFRLQELQQAGISRVYLELQGEPSESDSDVPRTAAEVLARAGIESEAFVAGELAWYDGSISAMDVEIARLLEGLDAQGLLDKTVIAFISDHGDEVLDHGEMGHGHTVYGELLNVPLLLWWPGVIPANTVVDEVVESIDLMPTLLDLVGMEPVTRAQGQSLLPLLIDSDTPAGFGWESRGAYAELQVDGGRSSRQASALISNGWKLIRNGEPLEGRPEFELYDYQTDRLDQENVAADHPDIIERMAEDLELRRQYAIVSRVPADERPMETLSSQQLRRLRAMGYLN